MFQSSYSCCVKFVLKGIARIWFVRGIFASFYLSAFFCVCWPFCENSALASTVERFSDMLCRFYGHDVVKTFETLSPSRISFFSCQPNLRDKHPQKSVMPCHWLCQLRNFSHKIQVSGLHSMMYSKICMHKDSNLLWFQTFKTFLNMY